MPKYRLTDPDSGKTVVVSGDSAPTQEEAAQIFADAGLHQATPDKHLSMGETLADMGKSALTGLGNATATLAGLPGDMRDISASLTGKLSGLMGGDAGQAQQAATNSGNRMLGNLVGLAAGDPHLMNVPIPLPGSGAVDKTISNAVGGYHQPQSVPGEYARTVASFAPNAFGASSIPQALARAAVPGIASETAGQMTKGKSYEPIARAVGGLVGAVGEGMGEGVLAKRLNPTPSMDQLGQIKGDLYKTAKDAGVEIRPDSFQKFTTDLGAQITKENVVQKELHPNTFAALNMLQEEAASGAPVSLERADAIRQVVRDAADGAAKGDARLIRKLREGLDAYLDNLSPQDTLAGDASTAVPILKEARSVAQREFKAKEIQKLMDLAENAASTNYSASGYEQALRAQFKNFNAQLIKDPALAKSFSDAELAAIVRVAKGGPVGNVLRLFGKLAPTNNISMGVGPSLGAAAGAYLGGPVGAGVGAVAVPALGAASRAGATALTSRNARLAEELMRAGPQAVNPGATALPRNVLLGALLSQSAHH